MLRVRDNGHGMDAATLARVFEPFFTTKQVGRGTGLGLSMVHGFVKQSGGHVLIDSVEGGGTSITMMFPRSPLALPCEARVPQTGLAGYSPREETVLVAEDNDDVRAHTVDALRLLGYRVLEAHDGPSALRLLERPDTKVDLLFSDVVMPGMSGWELVRCVNAGRQSRSCSRQAIHATTMRLARRGVQPPCCRSRLPAVTWRWRCAPRWRLRRAEVRRTDRACLPRSG
jgi:CheY-like chemotaxis protein